MSTPSRSSLRRIGALVIIPMIMLLGACGMKTDLKKLIQRVVLKT